MTPAEFDTRRRSLGLSVAECASFLDVSERAIHRWTTGANPIPDSVPDMLGDLEDAMMNAVDHAAALASDKTMTGPVVLYRYRTPEDQARSPHAASLPLGAHAMMIAWAQDAIEAQGIDTLIEWASD